MLLLLQPEDAGCHHDCHYDEFGFRLDETEEASTRHSSPGKHNAATQSVPLEDGQHRDDWIAYLEFAHSDNTAAELTWDQVDRYLDKTDKLNSMITEKGNLKATGRFSFCGLLNSVRGCVDPTQVDSTQTQVGPTLFDPIRLDSTRTDSTRTDLTRAD